MAIGHAAVKTLRTSSLGSQKPAGKKPLAFQFAELAGKNQLEQSVSGIHKLMGRQPFSSKKLIPLKLQRPGHMGDFLLHHTPDRGGGLAKIDRRIFFPVQMQDNLKRNRAPICLPLVFFERLQTFDKGTQGGKRLVIINEHQLSSTFRRLDPHLNKKVAQGLQKCRPPSLKNLFPLI
ncbi:MAG: hypothetical protein NT087_12900 [Deltaproteobacteria bacterium]|nr:hypothetical protein [Deltaproteobacteria bacterium]